MVFGDVIYGCTYALFAKVLTNLGVTSTRVDTTKIEEVEKAIQPNTSLVYVETPANPTLKISDISAIAKAVHKHPGITMIADSTFASPCYTSILYHVLRNHQALARKIETILKVCYPLPNIIIVLMIVLTGNGPDMFWVIVDITLVIPIFFNIIALVAMGGKYKELLNDYKARYLGVGKVDPNFKIFCEE